MSVLRKIIVATLCLTLVCAPVFSAPGPSTTPLGTVIAAERARIGETSVDVGTTVYSGDRMSTDAQGSLQVRAGAARFLLLSSSTAVVNLNAGAPSAQLLLGTATFSTGNARAFTLYASKAAIRAQTDAPTIGQVTYVTEKELLVTARRGPLTVTVEDDVQVIPEGKSFRVLLDPAADAQGPAGAGSGDNGGFGNGKGPLRAGRSRFLIIAVSLTAIATYFAVSEALESAARP